MKSKLTKNNNKQIIIFFVFLLLVISPVFSQADIMPAGLTSLAGSIAGIFTSGFVRFILIACLCGCAVTYAFNKDNEKMKRNCIAIGIAIAVLMSSTFIVDAVMSASK